jgi:hypothetical protein
VYVLDDKQDAVWITEGPERAEDRFGNRCTVTVLALGHEFAGRGKFRQETYEPGRRWKYLAPGDVVERGETCAQRLRNRSVRIARGIFVGRSDEHRNAALPRETRNFQHKSRLADAGGAADRRDPAATLER